MGINLAVNSVQTDRYEEMQMAPILDHACQLQLSAMPMKKVNMVSVKHVLMVRLLVVITLSVSLVPRVKYAAMQMAQLPGTAFQQLIFVLQMNELLMEGVCFVVMEW